MKRILIPLLATAISFFAHGSEEKCREIAQREYPSDERMQDFAYKKQVAALRYMLAAASDSDAERIALREYPDDYSMQKFTYDKQLSAKRYMLQVTDQEVKRIGLREYPDDFSMQKFTYDKQLSAKTYMNAQPSNSAKQAAVEEYPNDFSMQKFIFDRISESLGIDSLEQPPVRNPAVEASPELDFEGSYWPLSSDRSFSYRFRFKNGEGVNTIKILDAGIKGISAYYGVSENDAASKNNLTIDGHILPGLDVYRITDRGIETAECFWMRDLSGIKGDDFQLLLKFPLEEGDVTKLIAHKGEHLVTVKVAGFEDISVASGTFRKCAKLEVDDHWESGTSYKSTFWLAKGVGVVKWIRTTGRVEELSSFQIPVNLEKKK